MCFLGIVQHKRGISAITQIQKNSVTKDVTFAENKPFFEESYLQEESSLEDKISLHLGFTEINLATPKTLEKIGKSVPEIGKSAPKMNLTAPEKPPEHNEIAPEIPESSPKIYKEDGPTSPLLVYSRRRVEPKPMQVQESEPITGNESFLNSPSQNLPLTEFIDLDIPIAIRKGTRKRSEERRVGKEC